jgi:hypothetical protein
MRPMRNLAGGTFLFWHAGTGGQGLRAGVVRDWALLCVLVQEPVGNWVRFVKMRGLPGPATGLHFPILCCIVSHFVASASIGLRESLTATVEIVKELGWSRQNTLQRVREANGERGYLLVRCKNSMGLGED